jgi:hypothetical protein
MCLKWNNTDDLVKQGEIRYLDGIFKQGSNIEVHIETCLRDQ